MMLRTVYNILRMPPVKRKSSLKRLSVLDRIRMSISFRILTTLKKRYEHMRFPMKSEWRPAMKS